MTLNNIKDIKAKITDIIDSLEAWKYLWMALQLSPIIHMKKTVPNPIWIALEIRKTLLSLILLNPRISPKMEYKIPILEAI